MQKRTISKSVNIYIRLPAFQTLNQTLSHVKKLMFQQMTQSKQKGGSQHAYDSWRPNTGDITSARANNPFTLLSALAS